MRWKLPALHEGRQKIQEEHVDYRVPEKPMALLAIPALQVVQNSELTVLEKTQPGVHLQLQDKELLLQHPLPNEAAQMHPDT